MTKLSELAAFDPIIPGRDGQTTPQELLEKGAVFDIIELAFLPALDNGRDSWKVFIQEKDGRLGFFYWYDNALWHSRFTGAKDNQRLPIQHVRIERKPTQLPGKQKYFLDIVDTGEEYGNQFTRNRAMQAPEIAQSSDNSSDGLSGAEGYRAAL